MARACATVLAAVLLASPVSAQTVPTPDPTVNVRLDQRDIVVSPEGSFRFTATVDLSSPSERLEVRLRIHNPSGKLLFQKTETQTGVETGRSVYVFERDLADLRLAEGRYPVDVRVRAAGFDEVVEESRMLVMAPGRAEVPILIVARFGCAPATDPDGRFVINPEDSVGMRDAASQLSSLGRREAPIAVALPPVMMQDWLRASAGYERVGPDGVVSVPPDSSVSRGYGAALKALADAIDERRMELLSVPFAEPDLVGLQAMMAMDDLSEHLDRGVSVSQAVLATEPAPAMAISGDSVSGDALSIMAEHGMESVLLGAASARSGDTTPAPGVYSVAESSLSALIIDESASDALERGDADAFVDSLFDAAVREDSRPVIAQTWIGPGHHGTSVGLERVLSAVARLPWARVVRSDRLSGLATEEVSLPETARPGPAAPVGYWAEVLEARRQARAFVEAVGANDPDADAAIIDMLIAESRCWAGPDGSWGLVDRGRSFASAALRDAQAVLAGVTLSGSDVTLAGRTGKIPVSILNGSTKNLKVLIRATSDVASVGPPRELEVTLRPADNFVTFPVSLSQALSDDVHIRVLAGDVELASTEVRVSASYLDRLAVIGGVVLVLGALLFYIRRRTSTA